MAPIPWRIQFELALIPFYGPAGAKKAAAVLLPAILRDFRKMLAKHPSGTIVSETYNTEDRQTAIHLTGERLQTRQGETLILRTLKVGNKDILLSGRIGGKAGEKI